MKRLSWLLLVLLLAACGPSGNDGAADDEARARLPAPLARLTLCEDCATVTPVPFAHALHLDPSVMGRPMACADCHHLLEDDPTRIPVACSTCHPSEDEPHDDDDIPDI